MDIVITYVNSADPVWQKQYAEVSQQPQLTKRYRDWGLLPYLLRGIHNYMPFIDRVHLVVSQESQVPEWIDHEQVHIVLHKDIISAEYLPTYNSTTIELFLHRIHGLSEQFIYFNDDCFPVLPMNKDDFFHGDLPVIHFSRHLLALNLYKQQCKQSDRMAQKALNRKGRGCFVRPQHTCTAMLRSSQVAVYEQLAASLHPHITMFRREDNSNQYLYSDYLYYAGKVVNQRILTKHCSMAVYGAQQIAAMIQQPRTKILCINDVEMSEERFVTAQATLLQAFEMLFPVKSRFEK